MAQLYRTQILLERAQHDSLRELAAAEGRSVSDVVREAVAEYLVEQERTRRRESWRQAMEEFAQIRAAIEAEHGVLPEEFFLRDRDEREEELWQRMVGDS
jgi:hypothetical protein